MITIEGKRIEICSKKCSKLSGFDCFYLMLSVSMDEVAVMERERFVPTVFVVNH